VENREIIRRRQKARKILVQALYQWQLNKSDVAEIQAQFLAEHNPEKLDIPYFSEILRGITQKSQEIDEHIIPLLDRPVEMINPVEFAILRLSTYEYIYCLDIPFRVIIDEAVSLCKTYGTIEGHRYVNGVLHHLSIKLRALETAARKS
jgi:N utilization substance protein B